MNGAPSTSATPSSTSALSTRNKNARARAAFEPLAFTHKREYVTWIVEAKKPETRAARLAKTVEMLAKGKKNPTDK